MAPRKNAKRDAKRTAGPSLQLTKLKAIAQQDESICKMAVEATAFIAYCADAFLGDLVSASVERAKAAGPREYQKGGRKPPSSRVVRQILPEDVRKAAAEEERFDFLQPILAPPSKGAASASANRGAKRTSSTKTGWQPRGGPRPQKQQKMDGSEGLDAAAHSSLALGAVKSGGGEGGGLLALAGLDEESRRAVLLGGASTKSAAASGMGDEDDEDYDN